MGGRDPIELRGIGYSYGTGELARPVLRDVDLAVGPGEIVLLTGPSGSGKTTLLTLIGALRAVQTGSAVVLGQQLGGATERQRVALRRRIGFIFAFGSLMGLVVGMVIVYQILFSDISSHLREYATLKAMGYSGWYLGRAVLSAALILAVLGFLPGFALSAFLYDVIGKGTFLPLVMDAPRALGVFAMIFTMCAVAGLLAMRKLRDANPADMF